MAKVLSTSTANFAGSGDDLGEVEEFQRGVRGRFDDDEPGVRLDRGGDAVDGRPGDGRAEQATLQDVIGSAVQRTDRDDVRLAVGHRRDQACCERCHPAGERDGPLGALQIGERILEPRHTGLPQALVHGAAAGPEVVARGQLLICETAAVDVGQRVGRGEVDRGDVCTALAEPCHSGVHSAGLESGMPLVHPIRTAETCFNGNRT